MTIRWFGLVAPEGVPTADRRMFKPQALSYREFPLFAAWQRSTGQGGHAGSVAVATWDRQYAAEGGIWGEGTFLDPQVVPEVLEAMYLLEKRIIGPSVDLDPDLDYEVVEHPTQEGQFALQVTKATVHGVTFVMGPAFPQVHVTVDNDEEMAILASAGITMATFAVNKSAWRRWPVAPRETEFDADSAIDRIAAWSGGDPSRFGSAFLYQNKDMPPNNRESYRLPVGDIHNGKLTLIPRAVFSAGVILSGGHGGLEDTVSQEERTQLQQVVTEMYDNLREAYGDPRVIAPWQRGGREGATSAQASLEGAEVFTTDEAAYVDALCAAGADVRPPKAFFADPKLKTKTPITITNDGHVFGHLAVWRTCHLGIGNRCQMAPKSATNYSHFKLGSVLTAEGQTLPVGKITLGAGHADEKFGVIPAIEHYDNTGTCVAVVNAGEDSTGVWVSGALVAGLSEDRIAELRRSPLSGDWRRVNRNLELVAALAVNSPGFPVAHSYTEGNDVYSLTAAGVLEDAHGGDHVQHVQDILGGVDSFLAHREAGRRAELVGRAFHDLLPAEPDTTVSDCGCN